MNLSYNFYVVHDSDCKVLQPDNFPPTVDRCGNLTTSRLFVILLQFFSFNLLSLLSLHLHMLLRLAVGICTKTSLVNLPRSRLKWRCRFLTDAIFTLTETKIASGKRPSQRKLVTSLPSIHFQVRTVSFRGGK